MAAMHRVAGRRTIAVALIVGLLFGSAIAWWPAVAGTYAYEYDDAGRLRRATSSAGQQVAYTLDAAGNRTQVATGSVVAGTLSFASATYTVSESAGSVTLTVTRSGGTTGAVSVNYATLDGTALAGTDYTATAGTLNWAAGNASNKTLAVPIQNNNVVDGSRTFSVSLSGVTGGAAIGTMTATVTITDDDTAPSTPTNLRLGSGTSPIYTGNYSIKWNASTGSPSYYELAEDQDADGTVNTTYTINAPTVSKSFSKGSNYYAFLYKVRACNASNQCSAWSNNFFLMVCGQGYCP